MNAGNRGSTEIPAVVLGADITGLGVLRCLGRAGVPTVCASRDLGLVGASRWCRRLPERLARPAELAPFLERLPLERAVLFACSDDWVRAVAGLDSGLAARFLSSQPPLSAVDVLVDKRRLGETLAGLGLPHPRTVMLRSLEDLDAVPDAAFAGSFLKPCDSQACTARYRVKGFSVSSREDARARLRQLLDDGLEFVLQEYVPGAATSHHFVDGFVDRAGRIRARFARQRLRMHPPRYGNSSLLVSEPLERVAGAVDSLDRLLPALGYRGIFSAEFKHDERDGQFKLLEVNARPWWYVEFAALCGVDVCGMAYRDALGLEVAAIDSYLEGVRCVHARTDVMAVLAELRAGRLGPVAALRSWLGARQAVARLDDPLPALHDVAARAARRLPRRRS